MKNPKISIIVPIYNAERYLSRCINSIITQTFTDFELLLIDDGSQDQSSLICDEYAKKDNRIKVIHKINEGVSSARNCGLDLAIGEWICFVDADDYIEKNTFEEIYSVCRNNDIVITDYYKDTKGQIFKVGQKPSVDIITSIFEGHIFGALWNKFIKRSIVENCQLRFHKGLNFCEDVCFLCELQLRNDELKIEYLNNAYYHYCLTSSSLTRTPGIYQIKEWENYIKVISDILKDNPNLEYYILTNKFSVKWFLLRTNISYPLVELES